MSDKVILRNVKFYAEDVSTGSMWTFPEFLVSLLRFVLSYYDSESPTMN